MMRPQLISYPDMQVIMRKDFYNKFDAQLKQITEDTGAIYFGHNIIKNYREKGHRVSTFCNHESWHDLYWDQFCYEDPLEKVLHRATLKNGFGVISWEIGHNSSPCSQERVKLTQAKDGITFAFKRPGNYLENLSIGWKDLGSEQLGMDYIQELSSRLKPIRDYHWETRDTV